MSSTALKLLALVFMLADHVGEFIPAAPFWLRWIGRLSAPIFLFCMVWGFRFTGNRKKYFLRLYGCGVGMALLGTVCNAVYPGYYRPMTNNIFVTLLAVGLVLNLLEQNEADPDGAAKRTFLFLLWQVGSTILCDMLGGIFFRGKYVLGALTANVVYNEGGLFFVLLGVLLYWAGNDRVRIIVGYGGVCLLYTIAAAALVNWDVKQMFALANCQWMMIFAVPFMLLWNGKKGKGLKYLFYIFYPAHIFLLFWIGNLLF